MSWYQIKNQADVADVAIHGPIAAGGGHHFLAALPSSARTIRLAVASLGGDATSALQIAHGLKERRARGVRVEATITKIAASAATLPVCAAHHVQIAHDGAAMIHSPALVPVSNDRRDARALRDAATALDGIKDQMLSVYAWRMKPTRAELSKMLDATTWMDPADSVRYGLADEITSAAPAIAAHFDAADLTALGAIPTKFRGLIGTLTRPPGFTLTRPTPSPIAARVSVRAELSSDERRTLEGIRDRLVSGLASIREVLGEESSSTARLRAHAYGRVTNELDESQRQALEASRDDVSAALRDVAKLLGDTDTAARVAAAQSRLTTASTFARLNQPGAYR